MIVNREKSGSWLTLSSRKKAFIFKKLYVFFSFNTIDGVAYGYFRI